MTQKQIEETEEKETTPEPTGKGKGKSENGGEKYLSYKPRKRKRTSDVAYSTKDQSKMGGLTN